MTSAVVYAPYPDASARYRLIEPARVLGVPVVDRLAECDDADMIVLNRPFGATGHPSGNVANRVEQWRAEGHRVVVDMDDDFDAIEPGHGLHGGVDTEGLHRACKAASAVVCTTPALVERYGYGHGVVVPNMVPAAYLDIRRRTRVDPDRAPWVGWYGSIAAHPRDLDATGGRLGGPMREHGAELVFAGPPRELRHVVKSLGCEETVPVNALGLYSLDGLMSAVAEFDVGIVPLQLNRFNAAKSWLKGLEMAALGVPVIASPTPEYQRMNDQGGCLTASTPAEWRGAVNLLLAAPNLRAAHAADARAWAATWTYERNPGVWSSAWYGA